MEFKLNINMDNAAFDPLVQIELVAILEKAIEKVGHGYVKQSLQDTNGNTVGKFEITEN